MEDIGISCLFSGCDPWPITHHGAILYPPNCGLGATGNVCPDDMDWQDTAVILKPEKMWSINGRLKLDPMMIGGIPEAERGMEPPNPQSQCIAEGVAEGKPLQVQHIPLLNHQLYQDINVIQRLGKIEVQRTKGRQPNPEHLSPFHP